MDENLEYFDRKQNLKISSDQMHMVPSHCMNHIRIHINHVRFQNKSSWYDREHSGETASTAASANELISVTFRNLMHNFVFKDSSATAFPQSKCTHNSSTHIGVETRGQHFYFVSKDVFKNIEALSKNLGIKQS